MTMQEEIHKILDRVDGDLNLATQIVYNGPKKLALYVIWIGLDYIKGKRRAIRRRELKRDIQLEFKPGKLGSFTLTAVSKKRIFEHTKDLFGANGWMIGDLNLGDFTKEALLTQAENEERSAKGHIFNAQLYRALADPLKEGQRVRDVWKSEDVAALKSSIMKEGEGKRPTLR
jgi:hypothetical protein